VRYSLATRQNRSVNLETLSGKDKTHQRKISEYIVNDEDRSASQLKLVEACPKPTRHSFDALIPASRLLSFIWLGCHLVVLHRSPVYQAIHDRAAKTWVAAPEATIHLHLT
jgi:hypothetical protein